MNYVDFYSMEFISKPQERKEDRAKIAKILGINEDKVEYGEYFIANEKIECFCIKGNQNEKIHIKTEENLKELLKNYSLVFKNCIFKSFKCISDKKESIEKLGFIECEIESFLIENIEFKDSFTMLYCEIGNKQNTECKFSSIIFKGDCNFSNAKFYANCNFSSSQFKLRCSFSSAKFEGDCNFSNAKFYRDCNFKNVTFGGECHFSGSQFKLGCNFLFATFEGDCDFSKVEFEKSDESQIHRNDYAFSYATFKGNCNFSSSNFQGKCYFQNAKFYKDCDFSKAEFKEYCDFSRADFKDNVSFYAAIFEKGFDFSQTNFEKNLNLVNTDLNFDFEVLKEKIEKRFENNKEQGIDKTLEQLANDFRDGFRICKNALIKDNNLLDASNFHKLELYAKEIELKEKSKRKIEWDKSKLEENINKNVKKFKYFIEHLLLAFYRKSSDHHTDFLKIFNNLILLISLYAVFLLKLLGIHQDKLQDKTIHLTIIPSFFNNFEFLIKIHKDKVQDNAIYSILSDFFHSYKFSIYITTIIIISFLLILEIRKFKFIEKCIKDFWESIKTIIFPCLFNIIFICLIGIAILFLFYTLFSEDVAFSLFINASFVILYLFFVCTQSLFLRYLYLVFSYLCFIYILIQAPSIINIISHFSSDSNFNNPNYPALMTLNTIYIILSLLILFSVQKTARKNSIVPT
ncbi:pentapeptide repeat-containing protein [Campylobacter cuniculorum]|uniref:pentapeptide repeat-containing protein n=1 Tax=Campylobacter cuniculorum TaxID=374106 RepID=UPI0023EF8D59|nr:pentapeptide repeat-containing protein [Campylobacter cuniculorum]